MLTSTLVFLFLSVGAVSQTIVKRPWSESYRLASDIVAQLNIDEKIGIVSGRGQFASRCIGDTHAVPRLGIPQLCMNDGPAGIRATLGVTGFPGGLNAAATFNRRLIRARARALGEEFRGKGIHMYLGPGLDIMRNPMAGRAWESFGPDPYLQGEAGFETVMGIQEVGVMAVIKHLIANNQEHYRYTQSSNVDDRTMHELYWWPFIRAIEADAVACMNSYNRVNGTYASRSSALLGPNGLLRGEGGFQGFVMSDWGSTHGDAAGTANAGLDMEQPGDWILIGGGVYGGLKGAVQSGNVPMARLNEMVSRILAAYYHLRQDQGFPATNFDAQRPDGSGSLNLRVSVRSEAHTNLARQLASASTVLLKNNRTSAGLGLPLASAPASIAVIGRDAKKGRTDCNLNACNEGTVVDGWGSGHIMKEFLVAPIDAITARIAAGGNRTVLATSLSNDVDPARTAAQGKDVALVFVNAMSGELGFIDQVDGNFGDRNNMALWYRGGSLIERVASVNKNTIVIIHSTGPVLMKPWIDHPNVTAVIYAGTPGEQTGPSIVDILWGVVNPSGRLPFTVGSSEKEYPGEILRFSWDPNPNIDYTEKLAIDYRHFDVNNITPVFPFGFGLAYDANFTYSSLSIAARQPSTLSDIAYTVTFTVANTGTRSATEVPQLYLGFPRDAGEPPKVLRGFESVEIGPGASTQVQLSLTQRDISIWDAKSQKWIRPTGIYTVLIGASSRDIRLRGTF